MQEVTVGGQSILEGGSEAGRWGGREGGREGPEEAAGGKFFSVTHLTVSGRVRGKSTNWFALFRGKQRKTIPMESSIEATPLQKVACVLTDPLSLASLLSPPVLRPFRSPL